MDITLVFQPATDEYPDLWSWEATSHDGNHHYEASGGTAPYALWNRSPYGWFTTRENAIEDALDRTYLAYAFGYERFAATDGEIVCTDCAIAEAREKFEEGDFANDLPDPEVAQGDEGREGDYTCCWCGAVIVPAKCYECHDPMYAEQTGGYAPNSADTTKLPDFNGDHGFYQMHGHCLAELVTKEEAHKVGLKSYKIDAEPYMMFVAY